MLEILNAALSLPTVLFTALLGGVVLFWLAVILGGLDHNIFNADADVDMDLPGDVPDAGDLHPHAETEAHGLDAGGSGWTGGLLGFLNLGMVPVSIIASLAIFAGWTGSMLLELYLQPVLGTLLPGFVTGTGFLLLAGSGGLFASGLLTRPLRGVFKVQTQHGGWAKANWHARGVRKPGAADAIDPRPLPLALARRMRKTRRSAQSDSRNRQRRSG